MSIVKLFHNVFSFILHRVSSFSSSVCVCVHVCVCVCVCVCVRVCALACMCCTYMRVKKRSLQELKQTHNIVHETWEHTHTHMCTHTCLRDLAEQWSYQLRQAKLLLPTQQQVLSADPTTGFVSWPNNRFCQCLKLVLILVFDRHEGNLVR